MTNNNDTTPESVPADASSLSTTMTVATTTNEEQPVKRKRGRPPKNRPKEVTPSSVVSQTNTPQNGTIDQPQTPLTDTTEEETPHTIPRHHFTRRASLQETATATNQSSGGRRSLDSMVATMTPEEQRSPRDFRTSSTAKQRKPSKRSSKSSSSSAASLRRKGRSNSWTPPQQDSEGTFVVHSVTLAPILPPVLVQRTPHDNDASSTTAAAPTTAAPSSDTDNNNSSEPANDENDNHCHDSALHNDLMDTYPVVFEKGVPRGSSSIAKPFSSKCPTPGSASSSFFPKHKVNPSSPLSQLPTWTPLCKPPVFFDDDYDRETGQLDPNTLPVTKHITAMTVRKPHHDYLVLGDSVGFVTIYTLGRDNLHLPIAQLESVACQQRGKPEQDRLREDIRKRTKQQRTKANGKQTTTTSTTPKALLNALSSGPQNMRRSIVIDTSDTAIHALGMIEHRVVLATSEELECMDIPSGTSLWVCPLAPTRFVTSLDMHLHTFDVLVSCSKITEDDPELAAAPISPLMLLQHSKNNVEICDANSPMLVRSPSCTAIWDTGAKNRLLFIALSANKQEHELVLVSGGSIDAWKVACKTKLPSSQRGGALSETKLSQSPRGVYTLVASSRGIRLYQTESLQLLHVYGDQLALHGQSVLWKDCWLAGSYYSGNTVKTAARGLPVQWLQSEDWLDQHDQNNSSSNNNKPKQEETAPDLAPYIIGVPHTKGPKELVENLHIWKVDVPSVVPTMSIPLPSKSEGALGLVGGKSTGGGVMDDKIVLVTNEGEGHVLVPKMESNFAGMMYPPGYRVVTDNIEYIEEEDALDTVVDDDDDEEPSKESNADNNESETKEMDVDGPDNEHNDEESSIDEELREAMRQSLLEHKHQEATKHDTFIDILVPDTESEPEYLPCRPEPYLRQMIRNAIDEDEETSSSSSSQGGKASEASATASKEAASETSQATPQLTDTIFISNVLDVMPNMQKPKPLEEDCLSFTTTKVVVAVNPVLPARPAGRGRKSRAANLETMLKASVNPYLQSMMLSKQGVASNGVGSKLRAAKKWKGGPVAFPPKRKLSVDVQRAVSPREATNDDEAAVVMGLLGLSPCHAFSNAFAVTAAAAETTKPAAEKFSSSHVFSKGPAYLNSSSLSSLDGAKAEDNQVVTMSNSVTSSDRDSGFESATSEPFKTAPMPITKTNIIDKNCAACRGRHVIHSCGKRSLPIDYEEIARAARERKEKEEEEKKRIRAEKRRLADQKRREAKKQKQRELEAQRQREERERMQVEERRRLQEDFAAQDLDQQRRDQIVASYANHVSTGQQQQQQTVAVPSEMSLGEYGHVSRTHERSDVTEEVVSQQTTQNGHSVSSAAELHTGISFHRFSRPQTNGGHLFERAAQLSAPASETESASYPSNPFVVPTQPSVPSSTPSEHTAYSIPVQPTLVQPQASSTPSASSTLSPIDALLGLANLADNTRTLPVTDSNPSSSATESSSSGWSTSYPPSYPYAREPSTVPSIHGFGIASANSSESKEPKRGIPSYAAIRGQFDNGNHEAPVAASLATNGSQSYSWSARPPSDHAPR